MLACGSAKWSGVICALITSSLEITFGATMTYDGRRTKKSNLRNLRNLRENSRHESSLPNEFVYSLKVIAAVTTPDLHSDDS